MQRSISLGGPSVLHICSDSANAGHWSSASNLHVAGQTTLRKPPGPCIGRDGGSDGCGGVGAQLRIRNIEIELV